MNYCFEIDWNAHVGRISASVPESTAPRQIKVPLAFSADLMPCVAATVGTFPNPRVGIDTGSGESVSLGRSDERRLFPDGFGKSVEIELLTLHGVSTYELTRLAGLTLGAHREQDLLCCVDGRAYEQTYIGCGFLRRFHVFFDFPARTLTLIPREKAMIDEHNMTGIHVTRRHGAVLIDKVDEGSPAMRAGVRSGERLDAVDGVATSGLRLSEIRARFESGHGKKMALTVRTSDSPRTVEIVLQRRI